MECCDAIPPPQPLHTSRLPTLDRHTHVQSRTNQNTHTYAHQHGHIRTLKDTRVHSHGTRIVVPGLATPPQYSPAPHSYELAETPDVPTTWRCLRACGLALYGTAVVVVAAPGTQCSTSPTADRSGRHRWRRRTRQAAARGAAETSVEAWSQHDINQQDAMETETDRDGELSAKNIA